jgi:hypothetical protein
MPHSKAAATSMATLRAPVVTSSFRFGSRSSTLRGKGVRSRIATTTSKGCRRRTSASSSPMWSANSTTSTGSGTRDQSAYAAATYW